MPRHRVPPEHCHAAQHRSLCSDEVDPALLTLPWQLQGVSPAPQGVVLASVVIPVLLAVDLVPCCKLDQSAQLKEERRHRKEESEHINLILPVFLWDAALPTSTHLVDALPLVEGVAHRHLLLKSNILNLDGATEPQIRAAHPFQTHLLLLESG